MKPPAVRRALMHGFPVRPLAEGADRRADITCSRPISGATAARRAGTEPTTPIPVRSVFSTWSDAGPRLGYRLCMVAGHMMPATGRVVERAIRPDLSFGHHHELAVQARRRVQPARAAPACRVWRRLTSRAVLALTRREYYQNYQCAAPTINAARLRGCMHSSAPTTITGADWPGNPHPLNARTAAEMAQIPTATHVKAARQRMARLSRRWCRRPPRSRRKWLSRPTWTSRAVTRTAYGRSGATACALDPRASPKCTPSPAASMCRPCSSGEERLGYSDAGSGRQDHRPRTRMTGFHLSMAPAPGVAGQLAVSRLLVESPSSLPLLLRSHSRASRPIAPSLSLIEGRIVPTQCPVRHRVGDNPRALP